jgi:hypothetical protein
MTYYGNNFTANRMYLFKSAGIKYELIYGKPENGFSNISFKIQV